MCNQREKINVGLVSSIFLLSLSAHAITVTESFTSRTHLDSTGGMEWNNARGELHPPLQADSWDDGIGGGPTTLYSIGDGSDGSFIESRYELFDSDGVITGGVIEIDTDAHPNLQFTDFNLLDNYTIRPTGTQPLVIRVQTDMIIDGAIDCSGDDGTASTATPSDIRAGGGSRCGGGAGGASVEANVAPTVADNKGVSGGTGVTGGSGGPIRVATGGKGGGGGGSYRKPFTVAGDKPNPTNGDDSTGGVGGAVGTIQRDDGFLINIDGAGSGGGGGSGFDMGGAGHSSGGGGGAGGGNMRFYVYGGITIKSTVTDTGIVTADGGDGGDVGGGLLGGGGGGGGGGSILMFAGGDIVIEGAVTAEPGAGGTTAGGDGGEGAWGRTWLLEKDGFASGSVIESPDSTLVTPGNTEYETGVAYTVTSSAIDLSNTRPVLLSTPMTVVSLGGSALTYELAFSDSTLLSALSNFALDTGYANTEVSRYARFRIQIDQNTSATAPIRITDLDLVFEGFKQDEFRFTTGCGAAKHTAKLQWRAMEGSRWREMSADTIGEKLLAELKSVRTEKLPAQLAASVMFLLPLGIVFYLRRKK